MRQLNLGIIGVGHLGALHAKLASQNEHINLIGTYDQDQKRNNEIAQQFQTTAYSSLEELLNSVEAVSIVVPTERHYQVGLQALEQDCHLFIEKPITATVSEAQALIDLAKQKNKKIQVGHIERFNPAFMALKDYELSPKFIECHRLSQFNPRGIDVSVILDLMIHDIDIILNLMNSPLESIQACGVGVVSESEDIANVRLSFANGNVANITASRISLNAMRKMRLFQKDMYVSIDFLKKKSEIFYLTPQNKKPHSSLSIPIASIGVADKQKNIFMDKPDIPDINSLDQEMYEFARAVVKDKAPAVTAEEAMKALEVATTIRQQMLLPQEGEFSEFI